MQGMAVSAVLVVCLAHLIVSVTLSAFLLPLVNSTLGLSSEIAILAAPTALFLSLNLIFLAIFQSSGQPSMYLRVRLIQSICEILICLGLLFFVRADAGARAYSYAAALGLSAITGLYVCGRRGHLGSRISRKHLKAIATFGIPMLPHIVAGSAIIYLDRLVVSTLLGPHALGIYMVAMQLGMAMIGLVEPMNKALAPWLFAQLSKNDIAVNHLIVRKTYLLFAAWPGPRRVSRAQRGATQNVQLYGGQSARWPCRLLISASRLQKRSVHGPCVSFDDPPPLQQIFITYSCIGRARGW